MPPGGIIIRGAGDDNRREAERGRSMHILAIFAHPSPKSFNRSVLGVLLDEAERKGHSLAVRDLYAEKFNPVLSEDDIEAFNRGATPPDIKNMQEAVRAANIVAFIHPIWWFGLPAILKGWIDRVFSYGFAYGHDSRGVKPLLEGRSAIIVNTAGGAEETAYVESGYGEAYGKLTDRGVYGFVGLDVLLRRTFYEVPSASDARRREMLETLRNDLRRVL